MKRKRIKNLLHKGIKASLFNFHTIKPLDRDALLKAAGRGAGIVVCEEHTVIGGLASAVDEILAEKCPVKVVRIGVKNRYGQSGEPLELLKEYNLTSTDIENAALSIVS